MNQPPRPLPRPAVALLVALALVAAASALAPAGIDTGPVPPDAKPPVTTSPGDAPAGTPPDVAPVRGDGSATGAGPPAPPGDLPATAVDAPAADGDLPSATTAGDLPADGGASPPTVPRTPPADPGRPVDDTAPDPGAERATAAALAAGPSPSAVRVPGAVVFLGEENLDVTGAGISAGDTLAWFRPGADLLSSAPDETLVVSDPAGFTVGSRTRTGAWYNLARNRAPALTVREPSLALRVWDVSTGQDVTSRTVPRGRLVSFRIDSNLDAVLVQRGAGAPVTVRVQAPAGYVYRSLLDDTGDANTLVDLPVTSSSFLVRGNGTGGAVWDTADPAYPAGSYRVWAECDLNGMKANYRDPAGNDYEGRTVTPVVEVRFGDPELGLETVPAGPVTRSREFAVLVTGDPGGTYALWVSGTASLDGDGEPPRIKPGQAGVTPGDAAVGAFAYSGGRTVANDVPQVPGGPNPWYARVVADASGRRTVGFSTGPGTAAREYVVRVQALDRPGSGRSASSSVTVGEGRISIAVENGRPVHLGEEVRFNGTSTASATVHLMVTGPNLPAGGARLSDGAPVAAGNASTFTTVAAGEDGAWDYRWSTANLGLDPGTYTVWAVAAPNPADALGNAPYSIARARLDRPLVTANLSAPAVARGDVLAVTGTAGGRPAAGVAVWIFGTNHYARSVVPVGADGAFDLELGRDATRAMAPGGYEVVVQHPGADGRFDVFASVSGDRTLVSDREGTSFVVSGPGRLQGPAAADALTDRLDADAVDDTYARLALRVEDPSIALRVADLAPGADLAVAGTTNLAPGNDLAVSVRASGADADRLSGHAAVLAGDGGRNTFSWTTSAAGLPPGDYRVRVESVDAWTAAVADFRVLAGTPTPGATGNVTPATTETPGPGALAALAALAGAALLCRRRG